MNPSADFDIDIILLAEHGLSPAEETELRKTVTGALLSTKAAGLSGAALLVAARGREEATWHTGAAAMLRVFIGEMAEAEAAWPSSIPHPPPHPTELAWR